AGERDPGTYGTGNFFLPRDPSESAYCRRRVEDVIRAEGLEFLGWRRVPVDHAHVGEAAREQAPEIWQPFVGSAANLPDQDAFERKLYVIRKVLEHEIGASGLEQRHMFYPCSLSSRTIVYKGMLTVNQLGRYYTDLTNTSLKSALAMVHSRFSTNTMPRW